MDPQWVRSDLLGSALDNLERALFFIQEERASKWRWVSLALHQAMYHFMLVAVAGTDPRQIVDDDKVPPRLKNESHRLRIFQVCPLPPFPAVTQADGESEDDFYARQRTHDRLQQIQGEVAAFWKSKGKKRNQLLWMDELPETRLLEACDHVTPVISFEKALKRCQDKDWLGDSPLLLTDTEKYYIERLKRYRDFAVHPPDISDSTPDVDLALAARAVLRPIRFLAIESRSMSRLTMDQEDQITFALNTIDAYIKMMLSALHRRSAEEEKVSG